MRKRHPGPTRTRSSVGATPSPNTRDGINEGGLELHATLFRQQLTLGAFITGQRLRGLDEPGRQVLMTRIFNEAELVFGVWDDPQQPVGIGYLLIKGRNLIGPGEDEAAVQDEDRPWRIAVVPCPDEKLAVATQEIFGDKLH